MKYLNSGNAKTIKGEKLGWKTYGIHLAPFKVSGHLTCQWASKGCAMACLNTAGRGIMSNVQSARIAKTVLLFEEKEIRLKQIWEEIKAAIKNAARAGMKPCFRLNLTSDIPWESSEWFINGLSIFDHFPDVQFYDYTKGRTRYAAFLRGEMPANYHLTYSRSEKSTDDLMSQGFLASGGNVAVVFRGKLPTTWKGFPVVNGDESDLRFLDGKGVIVGLVEKGLAKKDSTGFVVEPSLSV